MQIISNYYRRQFIEVRERKSVSTRLYFAEKFLYLLRWFALKAINFLEMVNLIFVLNKIHLHSFTSFFFYLKKKGTRINIMRTGPYKKKPKVRKKRNLINTQCEFHYIILFALECEKNSLKCPHLFFFGLKFAFLFCFYLLIYII